MENDINNLKKWLNGEYVSPLEFMDSLKKVLDSYEQLIDEFDDYQRAEKGVPK